MAVSVVFDEIRIDIELLKRKVNIFSNENDLKKYIFQALNKHHYTKKIDGCYHAEIFFHNEKFSHQVEFSDFKSVAVEQLKIDYQFVNEDIKIDLIVSVETTNGDKFIIFLKCNYDCSVYDVEYLVNR